MKDRLDMVNYAASVCFGTFPKEPQVNNNPIDDVIDLHCKTCGGLLLNDQEKDSGYCLICE